MVSWYHLIARLLHIEGERYWGVLMPDFGIATQGKTKKEAYLMAKDALECLIDEKGFKVDISEAPDRKFYISASFGDHQAFS